MRRYSPRPCTGGLWSLCFVLASWAAAAAAEPVAGPTGQAAPAAVEEGPKDGGKVSDPQGILNLDIDQLSKVDVVAPALNMEVSTVERQESTVGRTPAAVFVITNDMIRRSGARTIPDVLRLAPGVQVVQENANQWAVSIRGFSNTYADKLLVQIDGRSVYTSLFGGVFWDVQDLVLEDVERIEVIRGPGATIWGANAVNGVINIITKGSKETQGGYFESGTGTEQRGLATARYGGQLGDNATYRLYGKWFERDGGWTEQGEAPDDARQGRTGFRMDWAPQKSDLFTLQGDYYNGYSGDAGSIADPSPPFLLSYDQDIHVSGENVLGRWTHTLDEDSDWSLQWYYDQALRHDTVLSTMMDYETFDLDFQYRFPLGDRHAIICGCGYRNYSDNIRNNYNVTFDPAQRTTDLYNSFVQDQIELSEDLLYFVLGSKFEHNDYTGFEIQPTARLLWTPDNKHSIWGAISRAVQTPTRLWQNGMLRQRPSFPLSPPLQNVPVFREGRGSLDVLSTDLIAYELGMRAQPTEKFNWDLAVFFNQYQHLPGFALDTPYYGFTPTGYLAGFIPGHVVSNADGETYGFELAAGYEISKRWNLRGAYSFLREELHNGIDPTTQSIFEDGTSARNIFYLWLAGDLGQHWFVDCIGRYVDELEAREVPSYFVGDVRLAYRPRPNLEWSVVGRNLLEGIHYEADGDSTGVEQEVFGAVSYRF